MREFCLQCNRPLNTCYCKAVRVFATDPLFALIVHPHEAKTTVGTASILRRSITNLLWFRSKGDDLDTDPHFLESIHAPGVVPLLLFPGATARNLSQMTEPSWREWVGQKQRPLFIVIDGSWTQAKAMLRRSSVLQSLPRVSFDTVKLSEYGFKMQPNPHCLSTLEGVHRVIEVLAERGWCTLPAQREHDQLVEIFRLMVKFQLKQELKPRFDLK